MPEKITIKDIANKTGTSVASVHRALHGCGGVGQALRKKILEEAKRSRYVPDETAALLRRSTMQIVVLLPKPVGNERFFYRGLWRGIKSGIEEHYGKAEIRPIETEYGIDQIGQALEKLYDQMDIDRKKIDGLITVCDDEKSQIWIERFIRRNVKVALVDRGLPIENITFFSSVSVPDIGHMAADLAELYRKPGALGPVLLVNGVRSRKSYIRYAEAVRERGCEINPQGRGKIVEISTINEDQVRADLRSLLINQRPSVIIAASARATYWVCDEINRHIDRSEDRPPVIGMDVFQEEIPFFENGTLKAVIYQSHVSSGKQCVKKIIDASAGIERQESYHVYQPLVIVTRDNYKYFLETENNFL